jgi:hypothetical protein
VGDSDNCNIGDEGVKYIIKARWDNISTINISEYLLMRDDNKIKRDGLELYGRGNWRKLKYISIVE